eukprot:CAMPEP_0183721236 /NCGR_PEP_ID=MMETSP0737-20130205/13576_1 /TAXON_ID=385413 /ORGANISM="Thalassiosira miniscula, Strain CCMP1093" /LENGTH=553 /DNA_ID=CAMNT_0025951209 /DNA_START=75 /DNA_END=1736 /DNA_ORIENTATION=+
MIAMRMLQNNPDGSTYQSIPEDPNETSKDLASSSPSYQSKNIEGSGRRCFGIKLPKSFALGIFVGLALVPLYDSLRWVFVVTQQSSTHHHPISHHSYSGIPKTNNHHGRKGGPRHSHPLQDLESLLHGATHHRATVSIGPRPYFLINEMEDDDDDDNNNDASSSFARPGLKSQLQKCTHTLTSFQPSDFVLGHRGAPLQFPEHSDRGHDAASRAGAGLVECDVNLTKDQKLICRHQRCDLHITTDVLLVPHLAARCTVPFRPAVGTGKTAIHATAKCCTTDFTLDEIQGQMCARMASSNKYAKTPEQYVGHPPPAYRTTLYSHDCPRIQSHADFRQVVDANGGSMIAEFKMLDYDFTATHSNLMLDDNDDRISTRGQFIDRVLAEYNRTNPKSRVYPQSFVWEDLYYVIDNHPTFGTHTIALDKNLDTLQYTQEELRYYLSPLVDHGVTAIAPTIFMLLDIDPTTKDIVPSRYAEVASELGLDMIAWTFERSDALANSRSSWYYSKLSEVLQSDSDMMKVLDVLYEDVGISGIFTDWPSVVTFYANCKGIALR